MSVAHMFAPLIVSPRRFCSGCSDRWMITPGSEDEEVVWEVRIRTTGVVD